jgi:hypothetical protein
MKRSINVTIILPLLYESYAVIQALKIKYMRSFLLVGKKAKYPALSWWENFMGGHLKIGDKITIYGENAMHWAVQIYTKKYGYIVFTLPLRTFGKYWGCHIYFSPNGTPWASTYYKSLWKENNKGEEKRAKIRKEKFGHNFNTDINRDELRRINN